MIKQRPRMSVNFGWGSGLIGKSLSNNKKVEHDFARPFVYVKCFVKMRTFDIYACFFVIILITNKVPTVSTIPTGRQIHALGTNPANTNITKEIAATVIA